VFLKLSNNLDAGNNQPSVNLDIDTAAEGSTNSIFNNGTDTMERNLIPEIEPNEAKKSCATYKALIQLRLRRLTRSPQTVFFMIFMPVIFVALGLGLSKRQTLAIDEDIISFNPNGKITLYVNCNESLCYKN